MKDLIDNIIDKFKSDVSFLQDLKVLLVKHGYYKEAVQIKDYEEKSTIDL